MMLSVILTVVVAIIHFFLMFVEMFAWNTRAKRFLSQLDPKTFEPSTILAKNVGLYNGFLGVGLCIAIYMDVQQSGSLLANLFLGFVAAAGIFGAITADKKLLYVQAVPAALAIVALAAGL